MEVQKRQASEAVTASLKVAVDVGHYWLQRLYVKVISRNPKRNCQSLLDIATNYHQWEAAAELLDSIENLSAWKDDEKSPHYEYQLLVDRLKQLQKARLANDLSSMLFLLRTSLCRNLGNMGNHKLYGVCRVGTKRLIEEYIDEVERQLDKICEAEHPELPPIEKMDFFVNTQKAFGKTALLLSGGAIFGLTHVGVVKTLLETKLLPRIISGASVGSIVAAVVCTRSDDELPVMLEPKNLNLDVFERPTERKGWLLMLHRLIQNHVLLEIDVFIEAMRYNIGDLTFLEAFYRTRKILNITVSSSTNYEMPRLLNYLTAPNVIIWSAVAASCSIPWVYKSSPLKFKEKNGDIGTWNPSGHKWIDGSVENDLPMARISELFGVNHFIVSQVNPHVLPALRVLSIPYCGPMIRCTSYLFWSEIQHWLDQSMELGFSSKVVQMAQSILKQKYSGDITIIPPIPIVNLKEIMGNPTPEMILYYTLLGEKATFPLVSAVKTHCKIELKIDELINRLRVRKLQDERVGVTYKTVQKGNIEITQKEQGVPSSVGTETKLDGSKQYGKSTTAL